MEIGNRITFSAVLVALGIGIASVALMGKKEELKQSL